MATIQKKVADRIKKTLPRFQAVLQQAKDRDVNESDTVTIITDMLSEVFGFDKYNDVTSEQAIRGTYCDLAVKLDGKIKFLIEVKAIGLTLKENHLRQAVNYGANQGIPWVILTNGIVWDIYRIKFERPINFEQVCTFNLLEMNARLADTHSLLYLLCKEGIAKAAIEAFHEHVQVVNPYMVAALMRSDTIINVLRRELRKLAENTRVDANEISALLEDVIKRDLMHSESADLADAAVKKSAKKVKRKTVKSPAPENRVVTEYNEPLLSSMQENTEQ